MTYRTIPVRNLSEAELTALSQNMKLSLSTEDMLVVQQILINNLLMEFLKVILQRLFQILIQVN